MASDRNLQHDPERPYSLLLPYGLDYQGASVLPSSAEYPFLRVQVGEVVINTNLVGSYNADNVMAAIAVGVHFGVSFEDAVKAIEAYVPANKRSQMTKTERNTLIVDAYNANPTSMAAALENFSNVSADCRIALLGDMLELGEESVAEHVAVIKSACTRGLSMVCFVGKEFQRASAEVAPELLAVARFFTTSDELSAHLASEQLSGATILIKGSRGTRMENVIPVL
jgi:UDP-N-acetylmuramoyl-tripeptide--D-alanyl-D-alanine ligase